MQSRLAGRERVARSPSRTARLLGPVALLGLALLAVANACQSVSGQEPASLYASSGGRDASTSDASWPAESSDGGSPDSTNGELDPMDGGARATDGAVAFDGAPIPACDEAGPGAGSSASSPGWSGDWAAGDYLSGDITAQNYLTLDNVPGQQGNSRQYKVHVPPGYDKSVPTPLLFCFHGLGQNPVLFPSR